jgi:hypothetical protein
MEVRKKLLKIGFVCTALGVGIELLCITIFAEYTHVDAVATVRFLSASINGVFAISAFLHAWATPVK